MKTNILKNTVLTATILSLATLAGGAAWAGEKLQKLTDSYSDYQVHPTTKEQMKATLSLVLDDTTGNIVGLHSKGRMGSGSGSSFKWVTREKRWSFAEMRSGAPMIDPIAGVHPVSLKAPSLSASTGGTLDIEFLERMGIPPSWKFVRFELVRGNKGPNPDWTLYITRKGVVGEEVTAVAAYIRRNTFGPSGVERFVINPGFNY